MQELGRQHKLMSNENRGEMKRRQLRAAGDGAVALRVAPELIAAAARAGWRTDDPGNIAPLPASPEARQKLKAATDLDRPVHDSGHRNWNVEVANRLKAIRQELRAEKTQLGTEAYDRQARKELEELQNDLRQKMMQQDRLTENGLVSHSASV